MTESNQKGVTWGSLWWVGGGGGEVAVACGGGGGGGAVMGGGEQGAETGEQAISPFFVCLLCQSDKCRFDTCASLPTMPHCCVWLCVYRVQ